MSPFRSMWYAARRAMLKYVIPEWYWPRSVVLDGVEIPVRGAKLNFGTKRWIANGLYEIDERNLIDSVVAPGMHVVEMGSSIGVLARILAHKVGPNGRVVSIEASPQLYQLATTWCPVPETLRLVNGYAFPLKSADHVAVSGFQTDGSELDGRAMWNLDSEADSSNWDFSRIERELGMVPDVLVVDIEGGEAVLRSQLAQIPQHTQHLILEFHPHLYGSEGVHEIIETLSREGFKEAAVSGLCTRFSRIS
jgi:FkbM family methyltransferase